MRISVLNHILALSRNFCLIAIITGWSFYLLWSHNADTNPFECSTQKGTEKPITGAFFCLWVKQGYTKGTFVPCKGYNPLTPTISSSNRGGGVAPDCMDFALKASFPWLQAPFCLWSVRIRLCLPTTYKNDNTQARGSARSRRRGRRRKSERFIACAVFKICLVHLFNSGLYSTGWSFYNLFRLLIFLAFRLFPWGTNQNLSERK